MITMQVFSHKNSDLGDIMDQEPEIRDLILAHKEVFIVHNDDEAHGHCNDCDCCTNCGEVFPKKGHLHPDCSRCMTEGLSKHPCETTQILKQSLTKSALDMRYISDERLIPEERKAHVKRLYKTKLNRALMNLGLAEPSSPVTGEWESAIVAPIYPIISLEDNKEKSFTGGVSK
jgi:hypothetical protein